MDELISRITAAVGIGDDTARQAVAIILRFINKEGPKGETQELLAKIPGATEAAAAAEPTGSGGLVGSGIFGGGILSVFNELTTAGLGMGEIQAVAKQLLAYAEEKVGKPAVEAVVGRISGLSQFV